jgi:hypothetical protein
MLLNDVWSQYGAAHPIASHLIVAGLVLIGGWRKVAADAEKAAVPSLVDWMNARQEQFASAYLTPAQLNAVRRHEIADLRLAADELENKVKTAEARAQLGQPSQAQPPAPAVVMAPTPVTPAPANASPAAP